MESLYTTLSSKGQVVIPAAVREALGIEPGTRIAVRQEGHRIILEPDNLAAKLQRIHEMRGITAGYASGTEILLEDRRLERQREREENGW